MDEYIYEQIKKAIDEGRFSGSWDIDVSEACDNSEWIHVDWSLMVAIDGVVQE